MSHCTPILTYGIEVVEYLPGENQQMRVAYNAIFRKVFGYRRNESVAELQHHFGYLSWDELVKSRQAAFKKKKAKQADGLVASLLNL